MKKWLVIAFILSINLQALAFEDYVVTTNGKLTKIEVFDNKILDVYPITTISNDKNTIFFHPLGVGKTKVSVLKNNKEKVFFNVDIKEDFTDIEKVEGFEIFSIDSPPESIELDLPPMKFNTKEAI